MSDTAEHDTAMSHPRALTLEAGLDRSARLMTVLTAVSRASGFLRVVVVTNVLGATYLANTYQTANTIPNVLFELFAAGALQAVLIPTFVDLFDAGDRAETNHVVGAVLGLTSVALGAVAAMAMLGAPWLMGLMVRDVPDPAIREAQIRLGTFFLLFFLPQVVLYGANVIATSVLNASGRFALPVFAPTVNNVVVIATYLTFGLLRGSSGPGLDLSLVEKSVLAGGTTLGVVAFCAVPVLAARRHVRFRPNLDHRHHRVRAIARDGVWAAAFLGLSQVVLVVTLQLANRREGAVAVFQFAYTLFLLPHALLSVPVMTTRFPAMSRQVAVADWRGFADTVARGIRSIGFLTLPATALIVALATPLTRVIVHGDTARRTDEIAAATSGYAFGVLGFGLLLFFTRAAYASRDVRSPTLVNLVVTGVAAVTMVVVAPRVVGSRLVATLGLALAGSLLVGSLLLGVRVVRRVVAEGARLPPIGLPLLRCGVAALVAFVAARGLVAALAPTGPATSLVTLVSGGVLGAVVYLVVFWILGGTDPRSALRTLGAGDRRG
jgi:putative peptidoglycan lipid II flippase